MLLRENVAVSRGHVLKPRPAPFLIFLLKDIRHQFDIILRDTFYAVMAE